MTPGPPADLTTPPGKWKPYPAYKDSGVEWLGDVPEHWDVLPLKRVVHLRSGEAPPGDKTRLDGDYPVYGANGVIGYCGSTNVHHRALLIGRVGASGEINVVLGSCWVSDNALVVDLDEERMDFEFTSHLLVTMRFGDWASANAQPLITATGVKNRRFACGRPAEQRAIADFLDRQTGKIDGLLAKKERLIELLQEKRAALIGHAVTKGLDPTVPMKDSGVEWLGDVPETLGDGPDQTRHEPGQWGGVQA